MKYPKDERFGRLRKYLQEMYGFRRLRADKALWEVLDPICRASSSTGCTFHELYVLYRFIRRKRPRHVLELGAGVSTVVMAHAVKLCCDAGSQSHLVAMEDHSFYHDELQKSFPEHLKPHVSLVLSPTEDVEFKGLVGRRYINKPRHEYGMVFIDGPEIPTQKEDASFFDGDVLDVREWNPGRFNAYLDCRIGTRDNLRKLFPEAVFTWDRQHKFSTFEFPSRS